MTPAKTHDLLRLQPRASLILDFPAPERVVACLAETPWVIVRRGEIRNGIIPIRVRGPAKEQRFDARIPSPLWPIGRLPRNWPAVEANPRAPRRSPAQQR